MRGFHRCLVVVACGLACQGVQAQWSSDAAANLAIADQGNQAYPKVSARADGGCWIAWYQLNGSNWELRLQLLDHNGYRHFPYNGILVSNHPQLAPPNFPVPALITDSSGNAVVAFTDARAGGEPDVYAYRIDVSGVFLWGPNGIPLSNDTIWELEPVAAEMTDGSFVFSWRRGGFGTPATVVIQKFDSSGIPQLGAAGIELGGPTVDYRAPKVVAAPGGAFILSWNAGVFPPAVVPTQILSQKYDGAGAPLWGIGLIVADSGRLTDSVQPDGAGGAFFAFESNSGPRVQHVDASGVEVFVHNGVDVSLQLSVVKFTPRMVQLGGDLIVFFLKGVWVPLPPPFGGSDFVTGLAAQRISSTGTRLWGAFGIEYFPIDNTSEEQLLALPAPNGATCWLTQGSGLVRTIIGLRVDGNGALSWAPSPLTACSSPTYKVSLSAVADTDGAVIVTFGDDRGSGLDLFAQNIEPGGALGVPPALATAYGCINEASSLVVMSGAPSVGTTFTVGIDNPSGSMPLGSVALLAISLLPDPAYPCGTVVPGLAMTAAGAPGEVLVSLNSLLFPFFAGPAWTGPGVPAPFVFGIPYAPFLVGQTVFLQGALLDPASMRLGATSGLEVRLGP